MVLRNAACTGDCEGCGGCEGGRPLYVDAQNAIGAEKGQSVIVETATHVVMLSASLVYLLPLAVFLVVYFVVQSFGVGNTVTVLCAAAGFLFSFFAAKFYNRKRADKPACTIVDIRETGGLE